MAKLKSIVIIGAGAGGSELAVRLSKKVQNQAKVILVNDTLTHLWKPLLHEIAAGTLNPHEDEISFFTLAEQHCFQFELGRLSNLNRNRRSILLETSSLVSGDSFKHELQYDLLVLALGSVANDFHTPGAQEYCFFLNNAKEAENLHQRLLSYIFTEMPQNYAPLNISIIGGGATGVELAAELHYALQRFRYYTLKQMKDPGCIQINLIESGNRLLSALPSSLSTSVSNTLKHRGIRLFFDEKVELISAAGIHTRSGSFIPCQIKIWAAGIQGDALLTKLDGLEYTSLQQLQVNQTLQTTKDPNIFAFGDCAACPEENTDKFVPPRAQTASQQAKLLTQSIPGMLRGRLPLKFTYRDYGSIVSLSRYTTIGQLMNQRKLKLGIRGQVARWLYYLLYVRHQMCLLGWWKTLLFFLAKRLTSPLKPRLKLH